MSSIVIFNYTVIIKACEFSGYMPIPSYFKNFNVDEKGVGYCKFIDDSLPNDWHEAVKYKLFQHYYPNFSGGKKVIIKDRDIKIFNITKHRLICDNDAKEIIFNLYNMDNYIKLYEFV